MIIPRQSERRTHYMPKPTCASWDNLHNNHIRFLHFSTEPVGWERFQGHALLRTCAVNHWSLLRNASRYIEKEFCVFLILPKIQRSIATLRSRKERVRESLWFYSLEKQVKHRWSHKYHSKTGELVLCLREQTELKRKFYEELSDLKGLPGYMTKELT